MEPFNTPLKIREISLPHRAVFGPMAGFTDAPARRLMAQHGAGFTVSEMVSSRALVYSDHKTVSLLKAEPNGAPYGVQIFGEVPEIMGQAAAAVEQYTFDFLDINMGCPAPKIVSGGAGSKLMLDPDRCGRIVEEVVKNTSRPVTVTEHKTAQQIFNRTHKVLRKVNRELKTLGEQIGLEMPLTTYVARHTFATVLKRSGVNIAIISESLGHSDLSTTQIYLDSFENSQIDAAMQNLL